MKNSTSALLLKGHQRSLTIILLLITTLLFACKSAVECSHTDEEEVTVTFISNGGSPVQSQLLPVNTHIINPEAPVKEDFIFAGWYADHTLTTKWEFNTTFATESMVLFAKWVAVDKGLTVTFESNGGSTVPPQTLEIGEPLIEPKDPTKSEYVFAGWFSDVELKSSWNFTANSAYTDITLYAKWIAEGREFVVTFESNGGGVVQSQTVEEGSALIDPKDPLKEGFQFGGWFAEKELTSKWDFTTDKVTKPMTLYAKWKLEVKKVVLTFESNGGSSIPSQTLDVGGIPIEPKDPTKSGALFGGWFRESSFTTLWDFSTDNITDTMTLYAKWLGDKGAPMILVYYTEAEGAENTIRIPLGMADDLVEVTIEWGDGTSEECNEGGVLSHIYETGGIYTVQIFGKLERFGVQPQLNIKQNGLLEVTDFGDVGLSSLAYAFNKAENLTKVPSLLPSTVTNLMSTFQFAEKFNGDIRGWNTENVTTMEFMFREASLFNQDIGGWNTGSVTTMNYMFQNASAFNQDIGGWNTGSVTNMSYMFQNASAFNQDIGGWNTENVTDMHLMFDEASAFDQDIGGWNTENVTDMSCMFRSASAFNQEIGKWNTGNVTDMSYMFRSASAFNQDIGKWNTGNVTDMSYMFYDASGFNQDVGQWNTENVTTMEYMFSNASVFNQDIGQWNTENVTDMSCMFRSASAFNQDIGQWNTENVTTMEDMFQYATAFNQDIGGWNTENVTDMEEMFYNASVFNQDIGQWNTKNVTHMYGMFCYASAFNQDLSLWDVSSVEYYNGFDDNTDAWEEKHKPKFGE